MAKAVFGLTLYPHDARYNRDPQLALSFTSGDLAAAGAGGQLAPVENNLKIVNDAVISRSTGSSARYTQPAGQPYAPTGSSGIGVYNSSPTLNVSSDSVLYNRATWAVHLGTVDSDRYPQLPINLRRRPVFADDWNNAAIGDRVTVDGTFGTGGENPDVLIEGWEELLGRYEWDVTVNCSPTRSWQVFQVGDSQLGRVDTAGSALAADAPAGSTSLSLATTTGALWTTLAADFPLDLNIGGIKVTASTISGSSSPQTATVTGVTKDLHAGDAVNVWKPGVIAL